DAHKFVKTYSTEEVKFFNDNGLLLGERVSYNGKDFTVVDVDSKTKRVTLLDETTGSLQSVKRDKLTTYSNATMRGVERFEVPAGQGTTIDYGITTLDKSKFGPIKTTLDKEWNQIYSE